MQKVEQKHVLGLVDAFKELPEYRVNLKNVHHQLHDIIAISVMAIIAGADGPSDIDEWAEQHEDDLTKIMKLKHGISAKDTYRRTLQAIKPDVFQKCFLTWIDCFRADNASGKEHIAIDGKTLRRSHDQKNDLGALPIVSAWSSSNGISLGQLATEEKAMRSRRSLKCWTPWR